MDHTNYRKLCVTKKGETFFYPKTIPKERGSLSTMVSLYISSILFLVDIVTDSSPLQTTLMRYASGLVGANFLQAVYRIILMFEERNHLTSRYDNSYLTLLKDIFTFDSKVYIALIVNALYGVYYLTAHGLLQTDLNLRQIVFVVTVVYLLGNVLRLSAGPLNDSLWIAENNGLDYGSGMAYSFFHGYLNLVLPKTGTEDKNLAEIMQDYEGKNGVKFSIYKLFILIPKSMTCFVSLKNEYSPSVEESSSLEQKVITVAGVQDRVYKNAVYKIIVDNGEKCYVSAEYATPLKTFKDVFNSTGIHAGVHGREYKNSVYKVVLGEGTKYYVVAEYATPLRTYTEVINARGDHAGFYNKLKKDIILQFYLTLGKVLEEKGLNQYAELIYYEDSSLRTEGETRYYDVGKIIHARVKELQKKRD